MAGSNKSWWNPEKHAIDQLNSMMSSQSTPETKIPVIGEEDDTVQGGETPSDTTITVAEARDEASVIPVVENREKVRILFITKDVSVLEEGSLAQRQMVDMASFFLEIHVVVLNFVYKKTKEIPIIRAANNVWLYPTNSSAWWRLVYDGYTMGQSQLVFNGSFRADLIVAEDLFESGLVGRFLSKKYKRPFQIHILDDFFDKEYLEMQEHPALYEWSIEYLLKHTKSIRTKTEFQRRAVLEKQPQLEAGTEILPNYYNLDVWSDVTPSVNLREKYPQFKFIMLHVSSMRAPSHSDEVIRGAAKLLRKYPTIGLVIVGNGPLRHMLEKQVLMLGLEKKIVFEPFTPEVLSYMKTADVFIHLSDDGNEDDLVLQAAVARIPMIANKNGIAGSLFVHEESACLCDPEDTYCVDDAINRYLNENQDRIRYSLAASQAVFDQIAQDYGSYLTAYVESLERSMIREGETK